MHRLCFCMVLFISPNTAFTLPFDKLPDEYIKIATQANFAVVWAVVFILTFKINQCLKSWLFSILKLSSFQVNITQQLLKVMTMKDKRLFEAAETDSVLEALYWLCSESESFQNPNLMSDYEQLCSILEQFPDEQSTRITDLIYHLCKEHEKVGFIVGVRVGDLISKEIYYP